MVIIGPFDFSGFGIVITIELTSHGPLTLHCCSKNLPKYW